VKYTETIERKLVSVIATKQPTKLCVGIGGSSIAGISRALHWPSLIPLPMQIAPFDAVHFSMKALCTQRDDYIKTYDTGIIIISEDIELSM